MNLLKKSRVACTLSSPASSNNVPACAIWDSGICMVGVFKKISELRSAMFAGMPPSANGVMLTTPAGLPL